MLNPKSKKTVVIHQPDFIPYLGFFDRLISADVFIILDHVQMSKRGWVHRDKIKTESGEAWLTIPIKGLDKSPVINSAEIDKNKLYHKIPRIIESSYRKTPYFDEIFLPLLGIFEKKPERLFDLNMQFLRLIFEWMKINIPIVLSSELGVEKSKSGMNADLVKLVGGTTYLSGVGARDYHEQTHFETLGIEVTWQNFSPPKYPQLYGNFIANLSIIDAMFNCGIDGSRRLLRHEQ